VYVSGLQRIVVGSSKMLNELMMQGNMIRTQVSDAAMHSPYLRALVMAQQP
jgi:hypothetical protein